MDSSGQLTEMARRLLAAMTSPAPLNGISEKTGIPLYRVRSAARELVDAGLVREQQNGDYVLSDAGHKAMANHAGET